MEEVMAWIIDSAHSQITFSVRHMMISNVTGRFEKFTGEVDFNETNPTQSSVSVQIEAASINTREPQRDGHLTSPDFLDAANYPLITFKSKRVETVDDSQGKIYGDLTVHGVTREVVLSVEYSGQSKMWGKTAAGFSATARINRKDWGLNWNQVLETGGILVGEDIKISIELEIIKVEVPQAA
jgi:polyisoprenoid-binding protein YceI